MAAVEQIPQGIPSEKVRAELDRILCSATFQQVDRLRRFLQFIVNETVAGNGGNLKEYVIGVQVFDKESSFDPRTDPIVRVQARRLRARLTRYFQEEGTADEVLIDLPRGRYTPVFRFHEAPPQRRTIPAALFSRNTLEVAAFADHSERADLGWFCLGLREEVLQRLASSDGVRVVARQSGFSQEESPGLIVSGSVRGTTEKLRATLHLIDGINGSYLWSETLDLSLHDPLAVQTGIASVVQKRIESEIAGAGISRRARRRSDNLAARNLYLQGRYHLEQRTEESLRKAAEFFEKTLIEDANYALAHSGLADAYSLLAHYAVLAPADVWTKAASSAAAAVMLDPASGEAHTSLAHVKSTQDWDWTGSEREFRQAIRLSPRYATAHHWFATSCLAPLSRLDEALEEISISQSLDPVSSIIARDLALIHCYRRDFDLALEQCDHAIELNPHFSPAWRALGTIQEQRGDLDEAAAAFERAIRLSPQSPQMQASLGRRLALSGKRKAALKAMSGLEALAEKRYVSPFEFALIHLALGQTDQGFEWLARAGKDRSFELLALNVDPRFEPWKRDPRFTALIHQLGLYVKHSF